MSAANVYALLGGTAFTQGTPQSASSTKGLNMNDDLSLYGIAEELQALDDMLDSVGGEITEEWEAKQEWLLEMLTKKVDGCVGYIQKLEDQCTLAREQQDRLDAFIKTKQNRIANFKHYIKLCMQKTGKQEFEGLLCRVYEKAGSISVNVEDVNKLPFEFIKAGEPTAKKKEIAIALKSGQTVEGARLVRGEPSIQIGMKKESNKRKAKEHANESVDTTEPESEQPASNSH
jgi:hypothetical protein